MISDSCAATWQPPVVQKPFKEGASPKPPRISCLSSHITQKAQSFSGDQHWTDQITPPSTRHTLNAYPPPSRSNNNASPFPLPHASSFLPSPPPPSSPSPLDKSNPNANPRYTNSRPALQPRRWLPVSSPSSPFPSCSMTLPLLVEVLLAQCAFLCLGPMKPALAQVEGILLKGAIHSAKGTAKNAASASAAAPLVSPLVLGDIGHNSIFIASLVAWALAQSLKVVTKFWADRVLDWRMLFASGGMPSSHSSMCCALTASVAILFGFSSPLFPITLAFTLIVMYDATSVRYHAGVQAQVLNVVVKEMLQGHPVSEQKLKEILGHTPLQVAGGALLGIGVSFLYHRSLGLI